MSKKFTGNFKLTSVILAFIILITSQVIFAQAPDFLWLKDFGGTGYDGGQRVAVDRQGNIIVTGFFDSTMTIGSNTLISSGSDDIFVAKFDANGNSIWAVQAGGLSADEGYGITADKNGYIYVSGTFSGSASFGGAYLQSFGGGDVFIAKYDPNGKLIWVRQAGGSNYDIANSVAVDNNFNVMITGTFSGSISFGGNVALSGNTYSDIFVAKYDSSGNILWAKGVGNEGFYNEGVGVAASSKGNIYLTGNFGGSVNFGRTILNSIGYQDLFLTKYDPNGNVLWATQAGSVSQPTTVNGITLDKNSDILITGQFYGQTTFGDTIVNSISNADLFIAKYDTSGNNIWVSQDHIFDDNSGWSISTDSAANISITGAVRPNGSDFANLYIGRYTALGRKLWSTINTNYSGSSPGGIANGTNGDLIVTASFYDSLNFGTQGLLSHGYEDIFLGKLPAPQISVLPASLNFNTVALGNQFVKSVTIKNTSNATLHLTSVSLLDTTEQFSVQGLVADSILAGQSTIVNISFLPTKLGLDISNLIINNDAPAGPDTVRLSGTGGTGVLTFSSDTLNFPKIVTNTTYSNVFSVSNSGTAKIFITSITLAGINKNEFKLPSIQLPDSVLPGELKYYSIDFNPLSPGNKSAMLIVGSNDAKKLDTLYLAGTAIAPTLYFTPDTLNFGSVSIHDSTQNFTIAYNLSVTNIIINSAVMVGPNSSEFGTPNFILPDTISGAGYKYIDVSFFPQTVGIKTAYLILSGPGGIGPDTLTLRGTGTSSINVQVSDTAVVGQNITMNVTPPAGLIVSSAKIYYRENGETVFQSADLVKNGSSYIGTIPAAYSTIRGVQYYIEFSDGESIVTYPSSDPVTQPEFIELIARQFTYPSVIPKAEYRMITIPLYAFYAYYDSLFTGDYGGYDNSVWRLFRWDPATNSYGEFPSIIGDIFPGNAFWLIQKDGKPFSLKNVYTVPATDYYPIVLKPGWNQIGSPFAFAVDWDSVENSKLVQAPIHWNPDIQDYEINQTVLQPWDGYWVYNPSDSGSVILYVKNLKSVSSPPKKNELWSNLKNGEFVMQMKASIGSSSIVDRQNYIGMLDNAANGTDKYDILKPPPVTQNLSINIMSGGKRYAENIVGPSKDGSFWDIEMNSLFKGRTVSIQLDQKSPLPDGFNIWFLDLNAKTDIAVNKGVVNLTVPDNGKGKYRIIVGKEDYAKQHSENISLVPLEYALLQNYPNPFNPSTNIEYRLKDISNVSLEIYNILGQRVKVLINHESQNPGQYTVKWDGTNASGIKVATGIYIYRIIANKFIASKKMILLK